MPSRRSHRGAITPSPERVELYERIPVGQPNAGAFVHHIATRDEELPLRCLSGTLRVDDLYVGAL